MHYYIDLNIILKKKKKFKINLFHFFNPQRTMPHFCISLICFKRILTQPNIYAFQCQYLWHFIFNNILQWYRLCTFWCYFGPIYLKFGANLTIKSKKLVPKPVFRSRVILVLFTAPGSLPTNMYVNIFFSKDL